MVLSCSSSNFFPGGIILCPAYLLVRGSICGARPLVSFFKEFWVSIIQCLFTLVAPAATPTAARLITPPYLWRLIAMLSTKIKPLSLTFQHPIYHSLVVLVSLFPSRHLSRGCLTPKMSDPLSVLWFFRKPSPLSRYGQNGRYPPAWSHDASGGVGRGADTQS